MLEILFSSFLGGLAGGVVGSMVSRKKGAGSAARAPLITSAPIMGDSSPSTVRHRIHRGSDEAYHERIAVKPELFKPEN